ncbi:hypothetical protein Ccrd_009860 [Cynara cardunculus var. scolymus]|uniref:Uncharacterized protein n=1 Tax=Cynara cardunculus var. scolymus TaxID=59895 RepID=A0A103YMG4_CYNCS|nr:hypothetical protein Ccrd_009860 [Cynara cardunculus var. scolymus]
MTAAQSYNCENPPVGSLVMPQGYLHPMGNKPRSKMNYPSYWHGNCRKVGLRRLVLPDTERFSIPSYQELGVGDSVC